MNPCVNTDNINRKATEWLEEIAPYNQHRMALNALERGGVNDEN